MCGICGFNFNDKYLIAKMADALKHRGPDDKGYFLDKDMSLGFRRLSIIDLKTGNQPISNEDNTLYLVFNGEIYNYRELRTILEGKNHKFKTNSDTETVIHAYEEYGEDCVNYLRGMFAFAIYDLANKKLFLARDRLGIKPLYFSDSKEFFFASELKAILKYENISKEIDKEALHHYLTFGYTPAPATIFKQIKKLPPGHILTYKEGIVKIKKYWDLTYEESNDSFNLTKEKLLKHLNNAVSSHLVSDVPIGVFLSGGMDSNTIIALMKNATDKIRTFSVGFEEKDFNELYYSKLIAEKFNTQHKEFILTPKIKNVLNDIIYYLDEPLVDPGAISIYYVSKMASKYVKVALAGCGGDEIFAGYTKYTPWKQDKILKFYKIVPSFVKRKIEKLNLENNFIRKVQKINKLSNLPKEEQWMSKLNLFNEEEKQQLYLKKQNLPNSFSIIKQYFDSCNSKWLNQMMYADVKTFLGDNILLFSDKMGMMNSLEIRVPLLDHKLVEFVAKIKPEFKLKKNIKKFILKETMKDILPKEILTKPKQGFDVPIKHWIKDELAPEIETTINESKKFFNKDYIQKIYKQHLENKRDNSRRLWALLCFNLWKKTFLD